MDGFLQRPTAPPDNPGVTRAAANTFPIGYYTNFRPNGTRKTVPDLPVIGALAEHYTTLDRYFCAFAGETFPVPAILAVRPSAIPTSSDVIGPAISPPSESLLQVLEGTAAFDPAAVCSGDSVQSVSPAPVNHPPHPQGFGGIPGLTGTSGMADLLKSYQSNAAGQD
jgi:hypothetical protein